MRKFITDQEIVLDNNSDFLKTKVYANSLTKIINSADRNKVFTIGLYGSWGSGKSSIIETSRNEFQPDEKVKFIKYDAWQFSNDSFRRMFLRCLRKELHYKESNLLQGFYQNESVDVDNKFKLSYTKLVFFLVALILVFFILNQLDLEKITEVSIFSIITVSSTMIALISGVFHQLKISVTKPYMFAAEQFEDCFKEIASKALKTNSTIEEFKYFVDGDKSIKNLNKLVIVIDNIDRCHSDITYQLLTDIKTFLGTQNFSIVFIIPVDDTALLKHFFKNNDKNGHQDKEEFLRKIFNVTLRIKPYNEADMFSFTKGINEKYKLNFKNETINIIGKEYSNNPRRVIQLINNLISELSNYTEDFSSTYETLICCVLILREEYPEYYNSVIKNASLLINYEIPNELDIFSDNISLARFIRIAGAEFKHSNIAVLNKILLNSDNLFEDISIEIAEMVNTFESEKLLNHISDDEIFNSSIYNYLCYKIDQANKNGLKSDLSQYFELASSLNKTKQIPNQYLFKLFENLKEKISTVVYHSTDISIILEFVNFEESYLKRYSIKALLLHNLQVNLNNTEETIKTRWIEILKSVIDAYTDIETCKILKDYYTQYYDKLKDFNDFNENQLTYLITDRFIEQRVNDFKNNIESVEYQKIKILLKKIPNKEFLLNTLFEALKSLTISTKGQKLMLIRILNEVFVQIKTSKILFESSTLKIIIQHIFSVDTFESADSAPKILLDLSDDNSALEELIPFIDLYADISADYDFLVKNYNHLFEHIPEKIKSSILNLKEKNIDITPFYLIIIKDINFDSFYTLELLKFYFSYEKDDFIIKHAETISLKINQLVYHLLSEEVKSITSLLLYLTNRSEYYSEIVGKAIFKNDLEPIKYLDPKLKHIAAKYFDKGEYSPKYINSQFLDFIFDYGDSNMKDDFVNYVNSILSVFQRVYEIVSVFAEILPSKPDEKFKSDLLGCLKSFKEKHNVRLRANNRTNTFIKEKLVELGISN